MNKKRLQAQRAEIEAATEQAIELADEIAEFREETGHQGGNIKDKSFGALKHAEGKKRLDSATRRLQFAYETHGVSSNRFAGVLHEYLGLLSMTWQNSHVALSQQRNDLVTDLYLRMIDPENNSGASVYRFKGVHNDGQPIPVHHFVNSVFKLFFMEKDRTLRDYDFKHFRLIDDNESSAPIGDVRVGQLDKHREMMPPLDEEQKRMTLADLKSFGPGGKQFRHDFENRSDVHFAVVALLLEDADISGVGIVEKLKAGFTVLDSFGKPLKAIEAMTVHERKVQRIRKEFFDGLRTVAEESVIRQAGLNYSTPSIEDEKVLADRFYRTLGARAGKPIRRYKVETKKSRREAQKADPDFVERTFPNDGPGARKPTSMDWLYEDRG